MSIYKALRQQYPGIIINSEPPAECILQNSAIVYWSRTEPQPAEADVLAAYDPLSDAKADGKRSTEAERNRRIDLISGSNPDQWRPHIRNTAAAVDLTLRVALGTSTPDDDAALVALKTELDAVETLETAYANLIAEIDACTTVAQVESIDVTAEEKWA